MTWAAPGLWRAALAPLCLLAVGCGAANRTAATAQAGTRTVALTTAQADAVQSGVRTMIGNPDTARFGRMSALVVPPGEGVYVCGHVEYKGDDGTYGQPRAFYVELRDVQGRPAAERGQVGSNPAALSKVAFMCRRHGEG